MLNNKTIEIGNKMEKIKDYFLVFSIVFISESLFLAYGGTLGYYLKIALQIAFGIFGIFTILIKENGKMDAFFLGAIAISALSCILHSSSTGVTLGYFGVLIFAYALTRLYSFAKFVHYFKKIMTIMCMISIVLWIIVQFIPSICSKLPQINLVHPTTKETLHYYTLYIANSSMSYYGAFFRAMGTFWEPGIFQAYVNVALLFELLRVQDNKVNVIRVVIFVISVIISFSTTGIIAMLAIFAYYVLVGFRTSTHKFWSLCGSVLLISLVLYMFFTNGDVYDKIFGKLILGTESGSFNSRWASIVGNIRVFLKYPLFGAGYNTNTWALQALVSDIASGYMDQTNTFLQYFSAFGVFVGVYYIYGWSKVSHSLAEGSAVKTILILVIFFLLSSGENFLPSMFFNTLLFYGLNSTMSRSDYDDKDEEIGMI